MAEADAFVAAAKAGHVTVVSELIDSGVEPDVLDSQGETALGWATFNGHTPVVAALLDVGADANVKNRFGNTPLIYAAAKGGDSRITGLGDVTPLVVAARDGHSEAVSVLLKSTSSGPGKQVALRAARKRGHKNVVTVLLGFIGATAK